MNVELSEGLKKNLFFIGISILIVVTAVGAKNTTVPDEPVKVGYTEVRTECVGIEAGVCLGLEKRTHTTYNYDNYENPEPGTENYYRKVESELMLRAYRTCDSSMSGMEWTEEVEYQNQTAAEWAENDNINVLPCQKTFYRSLNAKS
ncbi:MAG: hypothetical protein BRC28_03050 [Nanohaloarchaea archaeon SW_4_43_9]|nr:MAG: hypothetical protein BRC28_03050 [Nanohaloarchaea archaeon SW_4_43_9]